MDGATAPNASMLTMLSLQPFCSRTAMLLARLGLRVLSSQRAFSSMLETNIP